MIIDAIIPTANVICVEVNAAIQSSIKTIIITPAIRVKDIEVSGLVVSWKSIKDATYELKSNLWDDVITTTDNFINLYLYAYDDRDISLTITPIVEGKDSKPVVVTIKGTDELGIGYFEIGYNFRVGKQLEIGVGYYSIGDTFIVGADLTYENYRIKSIIS